MLRYICSLVLMMACWVGAKAQQVSTIDGIPVSSISAINGVPIANISSINGLTISSGGTTWTYLGAHDQVCGSAGTCAVTYTSTAGAVAVLGGFINSAVNITGCTGNGTWVTNSSTMQASYISGVGGEFAAYNLNTTGGSQTVTCTVSASTPGLEIYVEEWTRTGTGSATLDKLGDSVIDSSSCTGCTLASFTGLTGTRDLQVQILNWGSASSPSSPYVFDALNYSIYALNTAQTAAPTITNSGYMQAIGISIK